jgi:hypothetical protein
MHICLTKTWKIKEHMGCMQTSLWESVNGRRHLGHLGEKGESH